MPLISTNPVYGLDNPVDSIVVTTDDYVLKAYNRFIMNADNPWTRIQYGFDPIQVMDDATGQITVKSMPFMFNLIFQFIEDPELVEKHNLIQFAPDSEDESNIIVSFINWDIEHGPSTMTDLMVQKKQLLDCGNGVGIFLDLAIFGTPSSGSFSMDVYLYSKIMDPAKVAQSLDDDYENNNTSDEDHTIIDFPGPKSEE